MQLAVMAYNLFTSHYVSINSFNTIITCDCFDNLHPTMYLLIPVRQDIFPCISRIFTSHYVSINSDKPAVCLSSPC